MAWRSASGSINSVLIPYDLSMPGCLCRYLYISTRHMRGATASRLHSSLTPYTYSIIPWPYRKKQCGAFARNVCRVFTNNQSCCCINTYIESLQGLARMQKGLAEYRLEDILLAPRYATDVFFFGLHQARLQPF